LSYKDNSAPRSQYSHSHRSNSTRGDSKNSSKYGHFNERAANAKKSILRNLQQLMPEQGLTDSIKYTSSHNEYPSSSVEADPRTACIEKAAIQQHTSKIFWWHQYFKSSRNLRSVEGSQWALTSSFDSRVYAKNVGSFKLEVSLKLPILEKTTCMQKLRNCTLSKLGWRDDVRTRSVIYCEL